MDPYDPLRPPTSTQRNPPRSGPQSITVISRAAGSGFDEISQHRPGRLRVKVMRPCSRGRPCTPARHQRNSLLHYCVYPSVMSVAARPCARQPVVSGSGTAGRPLGTARSADVRKCQEELLRLPASDTRHASPPQSVRLRRMSFCLAVVGGERHLIHVLKL